MVRLLLFILPLYSLAQNCCFDPTRITRDTVLTQSQARVYLLETPNNEQYKVSIKYERVVTVTEIDNIAAGITYSGSGWYNGSTTAAGFTNNNHAHSNVAGNAISYTFAGSKIFFRAERKAGFGRLSVSLDGVVKEVIDLGVGTGVEVYGGYSGSTIKLTLLDSKYIVFDGFVVEQ